MKKVIAIGDLHCGSFSGLTPPAWHINEKRFKTISALQKETWKRYNDLTIKYRNPDLLIVNGDAIDGKGERSGGTELITTDREEQVEMAVQCIDKWNAKKIVITYGTSYHAGLDEDWEKAIADKIGAEIKNHAFIDINGFIIDVKHHVQGSQVPYGRHTAVSRERIQNILWNERELQPKANIILRSHVHYHNYCGGSNWLAMTLPALQAAHTKYGARKCSGTVDWGIVIFNIAKEGWTWKSETVRVQTEKAEVIQL